MKNIYLAILILLLASMLVLYAQAPAESGAVSLTEIGDSLDVDAKMDSLFYSADSIAYHYSEERIYLYGNTGILYQDSTISADSIFIDLKTEQAYSYGWTVMRDGDQILLGTDVAYDVRSQTGRMKDGVSRIEKNYYGGETIRKVDTDIYDIDDGTFTTCEHAEPDFWFSAKQLRIYRGDKIVGKPVIALVNHFPVFYFPFMTISIKRGRHPGFLIPEPGYNNVDGKFLRDISWYFPYKDYADLILSLDLMERTGWRTRFSSQYLRRYLFSGGVNLSYQKRVDPLQTYYDWSLRANHHHEMGEKATFDMNLDFVSNKRIWESSDIIDESLAQRLTSSMSYRKPLLSSYLNVGAIYTQDLINDRVSITLPSATFSMPPRPVYELFINPERSPDSWWSNLGYNYSVRLDHTGEVRDPRPGLNDIIWDNVPDPADSTSFLVRHNLGIKHRVGLSYNWKVLGWLNMRQGLDYGESWYDRDKNDEQWVRGYDYSAYASANFNIYGMSNFPAWKVRSVRHILTPSIGISYNPDLRENSRFFSFGGIGINSGNEAANLNLSLDQKWQIKFMGKGGERKINDVLGFTSRASANVLKDEKQFGLISHTLSFKPGSFALGNFKVQGTELLFKGLSLGYSSQISFSQDPYALLWDDLKMRNQYFSQSFSISGSAPYKKYFVRPKNRIFDPYEQPDSLQQIAEELVAGESSDNWRVSISQDIFAAEDIFEPTANNLRFDASFKLTDNWSMSYGNYYNVKKMDMLSQSLKISRSLHCWKLDVSYTRRNEFWEYRIVLFNTVLPDALRFQTRDSKRY
ncbi:MAG: putative LPS assembly protein LptD [Candidatus Cloacimonadaceae bacterium]|nr:putative LPS assembly protein LptD [Candidatus Cloacimonadaceae bacterium]